MPSDPNPPQQPVSSRPRTKGTEGGLIDLKIVHSTGVVFPSIPSFISDAQFQTALSSYGKITELSLIRLKGSFSSDVYAFVQFDSVVPAIELVDGANIPTFFDPSTSESFHIRSFMATACNRLVITNVSPRIQKDELQNKLNAFAKTQLPPLEPAPSVAVEGLSQQTFFLSFATHTQAVVAYFKLHDRLVLDGQTVGVFFHRTCTTDPRAEQTRCKVVFGPLPVSASVADVRDFVTSCLNPAERPCLRDITLVPSTHTERDGDKSDSMVCIVTFRCHEVAARTVTKLRALPYSMFLQFLSLPNMPAESPEYMDADFCTEDSLSELLTQQIHSTSTQQTILDDLQQCQHNTVLKRLLSLHTHKTNTSENSTILSPAEALKSVLEQSLSLANSSRLISHSFSSLSHPTDGISFYGDAVEESESSCLPWLNSNIAIDSTALPYTRSTKGTLRMHREQSTLPAPPLPHTENTLPSVPQKMTPFYSKAVPLLYAQPDYHSTQPSTSVTNSTQRESHRHRHRHRSAARGSGEMHENGFYSDEEDLLFVKAYNRHYLRWLRVKKETERERERENNDAAKSEEYYESEPTAPNTTEQNRTHNRERENESSDSDSSHDSDASAHNHTLQNIPQPVPKENTKEKSANSKRSAGVHVPAEMRQALIEKLANAGLLHTPNQAPAIEE